MTCIEVIIINKFQVLITICVVNMYREKKYQIVCYQIGINYKKLSLYVELNLKYDFIQQTIKQTQ